MNLNPHRLLPMSCFCSWKLRLLRVLAGPTAIWLALIFPEIAYQKSQKVVEGFNSDGSWIYSLTLPLHRFEFGRAQLAVNRLLKISSLVWIRAWMSYTYTVTWCQTTLIHGSAAAAALMQAVGRQRRADRCGRGDAGSIAVTAATFDGRLIPWSSVGVGGSPVAQTSVSVQVRAARPLQLFRSNPIRIIWISSAVAAARIIGKVR